MPFWRAKNRHGNWNKSLQDTIEQSEHYLRTKDRVKDQEMWEKEKTRKNASMFSDRTKVSNTIDFIILILP